MISANEPTDLMKSLNSPRTENVLVQKKHIFLSADIQLNFAHKTPAFSCLKLF